MLNPLIEKYARVLVNHSLAIKPGHAVLIQGDYPAEPLVKAVYQEVLQVGGHPLVMSNFSGEDELFYRYASEEQLRYTSPFMKYLYQNIDARLQILANYNTKNLSNVDPEKIKLRQQANRELFEIHMERASRKELNWTVCQYPTQADAQEAGMSLPEYEDFVFQACHLYEEDPVSFWTNLGKKLDRIADILNQKKELHFISRDTDFKCRVDGRTWIVGKGKENYPGSEVFTGPVEDSVNGHIRFSFPGIFQGKEIEDIRLTFENGRVIEATASKGEKLLHSLLETDQGSRFVGEVAVGCNYGIKKFSRNMLFDEKIGGTIHLALGRSYPESGGKNFSSIHWDMLCDMTDGGKILADNELIYQDGKFVI